MLYAAAFLCVCLGGFAPEDLLVDTNNVANLKNVLLVDARAADAFSEEHIPGAANLDQALLSEDRDGVPNEIKGIDALREILAAAGLDADKRIVIYSGMENGVDLKTATRLFWILEYLSYEKVSILNGGLAKWKAEKRAVETGATKVGAIKPGKVSDKARPMLLAEYETVAEMAASGRGALVDCRVPEEYAGLTKKEFIARKGNIPRAVNVPAGDLVDPKTHLLKSGKDLAAIVAPVRAEKEAPIVTYCNSGRDATVGYFAMRLTGHGHVAVYDGSMAEWAAKESLAVGGAAAK